VVETAQMLADLSGAMGKHARGKWARASMGCQCGRVNMGVSMGCQHGHVNTGVTCH